MSIGVEGETLLIRNFLSTRRFSLRALEAVDWGPFRMASFYCKLQLLIDGEYIEAAAVSTHRSMDFEGLDSPWASKRSLRIETFFRSLELEVELSPTCCSDHGLLIRTQSNRDKSE